VRPRRELASVLRKACTSAAPARASSPPGRPDGRGRPTRSSGRPARTNRTGGAGAWSGPHQTRRRTFSRDRRGIPCLKCNLHTPKTATLINLTPPFLPFLSPSCYQVGWAGPGRVGSGEVRSPRGGRGAVFGVFRGVDYISRLPVCLDGWGLLCLSGSPRISFDKLRARDRHLSQA
jgi:hypothetical protein